MIGTVINTIGVLLGASLGLILRKQIPRKISEKIFNAVGLFTIALGVLMSNSIKRPLATIFGLIIGSVIGSYLHIEENLGKVSNIVRAKESKKFVQGMLTAFMTYCIGPMTIIGAIEDGLGNPSIILTKAIMDTSVSVTYAAVFGPEVLLSALLLLIYQGSIALLALYIKDFLTEAVIHDITGAGGVMLIGLALNILEVKKIKVGDMLPALIAVPLLGEIIKT
ncbi:MAG: DUF554 domain-containing protein [Thermoprotei archaeon]|nr:MAG: DUF554 domain-containing protein [Thermoprotei archaeon]RLE98797.1 MAG: DUF554 domain-containing protein [Thermoprotei archaeon]HDI75435.1 DUF554 domain-containing protein [Thermoprotei archaeon]